MLVFWLMFLIPAWGVLAPYRLPHKQALFVWAAVGLLFSLLIGLRREVGGDWLNYVEMFNVASSMEFSRAIELGDPGYYALNWLIGKIGGDIYLVDLICASILVTGTVVFCRRQPWPWIGLLVAVPYMLIVVGMGYTRQAVALGFVLLGLTALGDGRSRAFLVWVVIGATFHKSAILLLPIAALSATRNRWLIGLLVLVTTSLAYVLLLDDVVEGMWVNYVDAEMESQGAAVRVAMNAVPACIILYFRNNLLPTVRDRKLWIWFAAFALACIFLVSFASTAVDRVALYLIPLQLVAFSHLPGLARTVRGRTLCVIGIVFYYASVQFVWLNFAVHAQYWTPYQFMPLWN